MPPLYREEGVERCYPHYWIITSPPPNVNKCRQGYKIVQAHLLMLYLKMLWAFETMECRIIQLMTDELEGIWQEAKVA